MNSDRYDQGIEQKQKGDGRGAAHSLLKKDVKGHLVSYPYWFLTQELVCRERGEGRGRGERGEGRGERGEGRGERGEGRGERGEGRGERGGRRERAGERAGERNATASNIYLAKGPKDIQ